MWPRISDGLMQNVMLSFIFTNTLLKQIYIYIYIQNNVIKLNIKFYKKKPIKKMVGIDKKIRWNTQKCNKNLSSVKFIFRN